jgi:isoleucyl-tRNA synthetase
MRSSKEILQRVTDGYRKLRNTARFALGNLHGFDPARDSVPAEEMLETDRWALAKLDEVIRTVREAYEAYEFHTVYHTLYNFSTVTLSARYFDILKDRLYTFAPRNPARRSGQTALYRIADALARMLAPLLVFTADEIWENLPVDNTRPAFVHLALLPEASGSGDESLLENWEKLFEIRDDVLQSLEEARVAKQIGSSLEARLEISAAGDSYDLLLRYRDELRYTFIVSQVDVGRSDEGASGVVVKVLPAEGRKCERCWNYSTRVGESTRYPDVCERCVAALEEIEQENAL